MPLLPSENFCSSLHFSPTWIHVYICVYVTDGRNICFILAFVHEHDFDQLYAYLIMSDEGLCRRLKTDMLGIYTHHMPGEEGPTMIKLWRIAWAGPNKGDAGI